MYNPLDLFVSFLHNFVPESKVRCWMSVSEQKVRKTVTDLSFLFIDKATKEV